MNLFALSGISIATTSIFLIFIILLFGKTRLHRIWAIMNLVIAIWGTGSFLVGYADSQESALLGWRVGLGGATLISVFFFHTICIFGNLKRTKTLFYAYSQAIFFVIISITTDKVFTDFHLVFNSLYYNRANFMYYFLYINWTIVVIIGFYELRKIYNKASGLKRAQALYLLIGAGTGFTGGALTLFPSFGINLYPISNFGILLYTLIVTYAILRLRLMDIKLVFRKSMVYSLSAGILTGFFVVIVTILTKYLSDVAGVTSYVIMIVSALSIAVLFNPLKNKIQSVFDKSFYKKSYDYYPTIRKISRKLTSIFDLNELFTYIGDTLVSTLGLTNVYLLYAIPGRGYGIVYYKSHKKDRKSKENFDKSADAKMIRKNSEIVQYFKKSDDILIKDELPGHERELGQEIIERMSSELRSFNGEAVAPVFVDQKLVLMMVLGEKESGDMFTNEDINLLNIVSNQITIAMENAQLYEDKVHTERLASIGMMSATFAHEIRNPLTSLKTFAQLMPEKYNDEEFRVTFSKIVVKEIDRINSLISDLLDFSMEKKGGAYE